MDTQKLEKEISGLKGTGTRLQNKINTLAVQCLIHASDNGNDFTMLTKLYHALPQVVRRGTFVEWAKEFAPVRFVTKKSKAGAQVKVFQFNKKAEDQSYHIDNAKDTPIQTFEAPKGTNEADPLTCEKLEEKVVAFIERLEKKADKEGNTAVVEFAELLKSTVKKAA